MDFIVELFGGLVEVILSSLGKNKNRGKNKDKIKNKISGNMSTKGRITVFLVGIAMICAIIYIGFPPLLGKYFSTFLLYYIVAILISVLIPKKCTAKVAKIGGVLLVLCLVCSLTIFRASSYKALLPSIKDDSFPQQVSSVDFSDIPSVPIEQATAIADKKVGDDSSLGSRAVVGDLVLQKVNGKLYYVAPVEHSSFLRWLFNSSTPGYVMVNANNTGDAQLITKVKNKPIEIKYQTGAFFNQYVERKVYFEGNINKGLMDTTFEIDDEGNPYWTVTTYKNNVGMAGKKATGVAILNAVTGEVKNYSIDNAPKWVDRIQPASIVKNNIDMYGKFIQGYFNFGGAGRFKTAGGTGLIYKDGVCYYYNNLTSLGKDESSMGFILTNSRTQETSRFIMSGATQKKASSSAEGAVQQTSYKATFPLLINVNDIPTYFIPLIDKSELVKEYAMVSIKDFSIVGIGQSIEECKDNYVKILVDKGALLPSTLSGKTSKASGIVTRIGAYSLNNNEYYNLILDNDPRKVFTVSANVSNIVAITNVGDSIELEYSDIVGGALNTTIFKNNTLSIKEGITGSKTSVKNPSTAKPSTSTDESSKTK